MPERGEADVVLRRIDQQELVELGQGRSIMLNGHLDINPLARGWTLDPFDPWE